MISRAGYAGLQRHALHWTGDNSSWWEHLWMSMPQLQNLGLSGIAWAGVDIGGFFGDCNGELLARWTEFGVFQPFCRNHSAMGTARQEPWAFGEPWETICRDMLRLRMRLLPYLYTLFEECHRTGAPILRPLLFEYPDDPETYAADDEFMVGSSAAGGADHAAGDRAPARLPAGRAVGALVDRRAHRGTRHTCSRTRRRAARDLRAGGHADPDVARSAAHGCVPDSLTWRVFAGGARALGRCTRTAGDGYGPSCCRTAHVEEAGWSRSIFPPPVLAGSCPSRGVIVEFVGVGVWRWRRPGKPW